MVRVAPIKLQVGPKVLWFDPTDLDIRAGDDVIVNTSRGLEYGIATSDVLEVSDDLVKDLKSPLKEVVRLATPEDMDKVRELEEKSAQALGAFKEIALESNKDMHPVLVEYLFEGDKAVFYFEAEERIDFRELVRKLADNGQIITQYVDVNGVPGMDVDVNPNGSIWAIEGITSPDGRVLGKMGHAERIGDGLYQNVDGYYDMKLFQSAKKYFDI